MRWTKGFEPEAKTISDYGEKRGEDERRGKEQRNHQMQIILKCRSFRSSIYFDKTIFLSKTTFLSFFKKPKQAADLIFQTQTCMTLFLCKQIYYSICVMVISILCWQVSGLCVLEILEECKPALLHVQQNSCSHLQHTHTNHTHI